MNGRMKKECKNKKKKLTNTYTKQSWKGKKATNK